MDWVTSQVSQNTQFSLTITLPIFIWHILCFCTKLNLQIWIIVHVQNDYICVVSLVDQPCWWERLFGLILKPFFRPVKIGLWRTSPPSPPLCAALTCLVIDKLGKVTFEVMACLTVKMMQNTEIYPYFPHDMGWKKRKQCINYNSVNHKIAWSEMIGRKLSSSIK